MKYICIGKIVNTHGIKGELRVLSKFQFKEKVFKKDFNVYIGKDKINEIINSYRFHKIFDMITLKNYNNINDVLKYKGQFVYVNREDIILNNKEYLDDDLINFNVIVNKSIIGKIVKFEYHSKNKLIIIKNEEKEYLIPYSFDIIESINLEKKEMIIKDIKGLIS